MRKSLAALPCLAAGMLWAAPASAYVGPGAGITLVGALWAVVVAVALALGGILFWPLRTLWRKMRRKKDSSS